MTPEITFDDYFIAQQNGYRFDIGTLTAEEKKAYAKALKEGRMIKVKAYWPYLIRGERLKTCYINLQPNPEIRKRPVNA